MSQSEFSKRRAKERAAEAKKKRRAESKAKQNRIQRKADNLAESKGSTANKLRSNRQATQRNLKDAIDELIK